MVLCNPIFLAVDTYSYSVYNFTSANIQVHVNTEQVEAKEATLLAPILLASQLCLMDRVYNNTDVILACSIHYAWVYPESISSFDLDPNIHHRDSLYCGAFLCYLQFLSVTLPVCQN